MHTDKLFPALDYASTADLVNDHLRLVRSIAGRLHRQFDGTLEFDDLLTLGVEGLLQAAQRFTGDKGAQFSTFAYLRIRGQILDGIPALLPVRRYLEPACANDREHAPQTMYVTQQALRADLRDDDQRSAIDQLLLEETRCELRRAVATLGDRERELVERCLLDGEQLTHAAADLGISKSWASRLQSQALDTLRTRLAA